MASFLEKFLFPTPTPSYSDSSFPRELLWVPVESDAVPVVLLLSPNARYLVLYFHSNGEDIGLCYSFARSLSTLLEVHVLLVEYPGYGICPGTASENSLLKAAHAAFRFVSEQLRWPAEDVIIMGRSLGAAVASQLAARVTCNGLILVAPFASLVEAAHHHVGVLARVLSNDVFNNRDHICKVSAPTLIVHGKNDTVVPCSQGRQLYDLSSARKLFVNPEGMHHNSDLLTVADILIKPVLRFFCLPDYTFQSLEVPPEFFGWRHRQQDKAMVVDMEAFDPLVRSFRDRLTRFVGIDTGHSAHAGADGPRRHSDHGKPDGPQSVFLSVPAAPGDIDGVEGSSMHTVRTSRRLARPHSQPSSLGRIGCIMDASSANADSGGTIDRMDITMDSMMPRNSKAIVGLDGLGAQGFGLQSGCCRGDFLFGMAHDLEVLRLRVQTASKEGHCAQLPQRALIVPGEGSSPRTLESTLCCGAAAARPRSAGSAISCSLAPCGIGRSVAVGCCGFFGGGMAAI